jgi:hypothetical protein
MHGLPNDLQKLGLLPEEVLLAVCSLMNRGWHAFKLKPMLQADAVATWVVHDATSMGNPTQYIHHPFLSPMDLTTGDGGLSTGHKSGRS